MHLGGQIGYQLCSGNTYEITYSPAQNHTITGKSYHTTQPQGTIGGGESHFYCGYNPPEQHSNRTLTTVKIHCLQARTKKVYFITTNVTFPQQPLPSTARENSNLLITTAGCSLAAKRICQRYLWLLFLVFGKSRGRVIFWKYLH